MQPILHPTSYILHPTSYIRPPETPRETSGDGSIRGVSHQIVLLAALIATRAALLSVAPELAGWVAEVCAQLSVLHLQRSAQRNRTRPEKFAEPEEKRNRKWS